MNTLLAERLSVAQDLLTSDEVRVEKSSGEEKDDDSRADNNEDDDDDAVDADGSRRTHPLATDYSTVFARHSDDSATLLESIADAFKSINMGLTDTADEKPGGGDGEEEEEEGLNLEVANQFRMLARQHDKDEQEEDKEKERETEESLIKKLTDEQIEIFTMVRDAALGKGQILLSVNNGPGTGKTTTLQTVEAVLALAGGNRVMKNSATTGAAATVFGPGTVTLHSALHISTRKKSNPNPNPNPNPTRKQSRNGDGSLKDLKDDVLAVLQGEYEHTKVFVIDEVSMLTVELLADTEQRLRQRKNKPDVYFGGVSIILVGDFQQLPPASGETM